MSNLAKATVAAGCFWGVEAQLSQVEGVQKTTVGYAGGDYQDPTYEDVCSGKTGHAEAVLVEFDPSVIAYRDLLEVFWRIHDPTTLDRQGPDVGSQYRSAIFYHDSVQASEAEISKQQQASQLEKEVVTEIVPASDFYVAEDHHQNYYG